MHEENDESEWARFRNNFKIISIKADFCFLFDGSLLKLRFVKDFKDIL